MTTSGYEILPSVGASTSTPNVKLMDAFTVEADENVEYFTAGHATSELAVAAVKQMLTNAVSAAQNGGQDSVVEGLTWQWDTWGDPTGMTGPGVWVSDTEAADEATFYVVAVMQDTDETWSASISLPPGMLYIYYYLEQ